MVPPEQQSSSEETTSFMRDIEYDPTTETTYECLNCGAVITVSTSPGKCPECGGSLRNREMPFE